MGGGELLSALMRSSCDLWCVWLTAFVALQVWLAVFVVERNKLIACGIRQIDDGDIEMFEQYLKALLRPAGFRIEKSVPAGLDATDLVISKDGKKAVLLLRKFKERVGERPLHATLLAGEQHGYAKIVLITNNFYTTKAEALARSNKVLLWNRRNLIKALSERCEKHSPALLQLPPQNAHPHSTRKSRARAGRSVGICPDEGLLNFFPPRIMAVSA